MKKTEYFNKVLGVVSELAEVSKESVLSKNRAANVVDARWIVIKLLKDAGFSTNDIAELICHKRRTIDNAFSLIEDRIKYSYNDSGNILATARQLLKD